MNQPHVARLAAFALLAALTNCASGGRRSAHNGPIACSETEPCPGGMVCGLEAGCDHPRGVCQDRACLSLALDSIHCTCDRRPVHGGACRPSTRYLPFSACAPAPEPPPVATAPDLLPPDFSAHGSPVPTNSDYTASPGCYIACYSHRERGAAYPVSATVFVHGLVRIAGTYDGRVCRPTGHESADISVAQSPESLRCRAAIPSCDNGRCWAGGDTGGFLGH